MTPVYGDLMVAKSTMTWAFSSGLGDLTGLASTTSACAVPTLAFAAATIVFALAKAALASFSAATAASHLVLVFVHQALVDDGAAGGVEEVLHAVVLLLPEDGHGVGAFDGGLGPHDLRLGRLHVRPGADDAGLLGQPAASAPP